MDNDGYKLSIAAGKKLLERFANQDAIYQESLQYFKRCIDECPDISQPRIKGIL